MNSLFSRGLAAVLAVGGVAAAAAAQQPTTPKVVRWPGGYMVTNGPDVVVRQAGGGRSTTLLSGAGNGVGNRVSVSNGPAGGVTVISNSRVGVGNSIVVDGDDWLGDWFPRADVPKPKADACPPVYKGRANAFWSKKEWSDEHDCNLYWDAASKGWYRYHKDDDAYRPVTPDANK